jgi:hypothetical protein
MTSPPKCSRDHRTNWLILYDVGKNQTEQILVCDDCYTDPTNDCFRLYEIQKILINDKKILELEDRFQSRPSGSTSVIEGVTIE